MQLSTVFLAFFSVKCCFYVDIVPPSAYNISRKQVIVLNFEVINSKKREMGMTNAQLDLSLQLGDTRRLLCLVSANRMILRAAAFRSRRARIQHTVRAQQAAASDSQPAQRSSNDRMIYRFR